MTREPDPAALSEVALFQGLSMSVADGT